MFFRNFVLFVGPMAVALGLTGCANWALKEKCEKTNWFEYSQGVAFDGRYLEEDGLIKDCRKLDRISAVQIDQGFKLGREKMCQYDEIYGRAKEGVPVFFKFCDGLEMNHMKSRYNDGLVLFCTADKGYSFGKSGKIYKNLCDAKQEAKFLQPYYKGRKEYLTTSIATAQKELADYARQQDELMRSESLISHEYTTIPHSMDCSSRLVYDEASKQSNWVSICTESMNTQMERSRVGSELGQIRNQLYDVRSNSRGTQESLHKFQNDLTQIP